MKKQPTLVVAAVIKNNLNQVLIAQRPLGKSLGGKWEFPGGKVDFGEDLKTALSREIDEELSVKITIGDLFGHSSAMTDNGRHIILLAFHCLYVSGEIVLTEHSDFKWVKPETLSTFDLAEADVPFLEKIVSHK